jgi:CubicO group peptidase (beta-lactamase class C family)
LDRVLTRHDLGHLEAIAATLASQRPLWEPGTRQGYHTVTWGWLTAELLRRVDPAHRTPRRFVQEEVISPLGLHFHIGTPPGEDARVAEVVEPGGRDFVAVLPHVPIALAWLQSTRAHCGRARCRRFASRGSASSTIPGCGASKIPSTNGIGEPRALAMLFGELATGGRRLGILQRRSMRSVRRRSCRGTGARDAILKMEIAFSLGFIKPTRGFAFASASAFASAGTGGSFAFGDPERQLGFAYVPNRLGLYLRNDPRERALRMAVLKGADAM